MVNNKMKKRYLPAVFALVFVLMLIGVVLATAPDWINGASTVNYTVTEDSFYHHNLSANITGFSGDVNFTIDTQNTIYWTNVSGRSSVSESAISPWIRIYNSNIGNLTINASSDSQTGFFEIPIQATNVTGEPAATVEYFEFIVNATNDAPDFSNIQSIYNLSQNQLFSEFINATDEESHYPLSFNITFLSNCTHASWSGRNPGENCSILNLTAVSNTSSWANLTPTRDDVGTYWANVSVTDAGENYLCPHAFCDNSSYQQNKTSYSGVVLFNVFASLDINVTDCQNKVFQEGQQGTCQVNITTKGDSDSLNVSSLAFLRNYNADVSNTSWFYSENLTDSSNFSVTAFVSVAPQKTEIGNWTINFTVEDLTSGENLTKQIYVYVNRTSNDVPSIKDIPDANTSIDLGTRINITVYDDDLLILDKNESFGGYNESTSFAVKILNQSNLSQELIISGFDVEILSMPVAGTNRTEAKIQFTPNSSDIGNYTINITATDEDGSSDTDLFNLSIISNQFPAWNQTSYSFDLVVNSTSATTSAFGLINLTDGYVTDSGDTLTFTNNASAMPSFSLTSAGIISFTPYKTDVGLWNFTVTATDSLGLQNTTVFTFNITNTNSDPVIETPLSVVNASVDSNSSIVADEDNYTTISLWIRDDDFKITSAQKSYYNESITINLTIQGNNTNLFNFTRDTSFPTAGNNRSRYYAIFTPNATDVGEYNITINITDQSNASDYLEFNLTVSSVNDVPSLTAIGNQTSAVNRTFYYDFNASDEEDGNDSQGNLTFSIEFLQGADFINNNETIFNTTSGMLNITFNSSQSGIYRINVTVNDTAGLEDSDDFWLYVYGTPSVAIPALGINFSLQENVTSNLTFQVNHSVGDNLTYLFYIGNILRNTTDYYGNGTNLTWQFTPNFTDESYGQFKNLTLVVYPSNTELDNRTLLNNTIIRNVNISHTNSPVVFSGHIGDSQATYNNDIQINLANYFSDIDHSDSYYNQTVAFTVASNSSPSYISSSVSAGWVLTLSSSVATDEIITVTGNDSSSSATSNSFEIEFTPPTVVVVPTPSTGGGAGGSGSYPVSLKILLPDPVSAYQGDRIVLPVTLFNNGEQTLFGINLTSQVIRENEIVPGIQSSFDRNYISALAEGDKENVTLTIDVNTGEVGTFEITINATVKNPRYNDWGKLYLTVKQGDNTIEERILFTQEFLEENPECIELEEVLDEAREFFKKGDFVNTVLKINQAIDGCKNAISQKARAKKAEPKEDHLYRYLLIATLLVFFAGVAYYSYKRVRLRRILDNNNLVKTVPLIFAIGLGFVLVSIGSGITGFSIRDNLPSEGSFFAAGILLIAAILAFIFRKKLIELFNSLRLRIGSRLPKYHIKGLIKKRVYTDSGDYVGKINEVALGKLRIDALRIKLGSAFRKKNNLKNKGIVVNYKQVKSVGHIVIVEKLKLK